MPSLCLGLLTIWAAIAPFTERGTTDFDTFLQILNPDGRWVEAMPNRWQYVPFAAVPHPPFSSGRWVYTDFGWIWQSREAYGWATDHYGVWVRDAAGEWSWLPDANWHPAPVEFRSTKTHLGWRPAKMSQLNELTEPEEVRYAKPEEWIFVPREKFKGAITPADIITGAAASALLEESQPCEHTFVSWREIDRPGPDPLDFVPPEKVKKVEELKKNEPEYDAPHVMALPTFWTPRPPAAPPDDLYLYRPNLFQDNDGIQRRIRLWQQVPGQQEARQKVNELLGMPVTLPAFVPSGEKAVPTSPAPSVKPEAPPPADPPPPQDTTSTTSRSLKSR